MSDRDVIFGELAMRVSENGLPDEPAGVRGRRLEAERFLHIADRIAIGVAPQRSLCRPLEISDGSPNVFRALPMAHKLPELTVQAAGVASFQCNHERCVQLAALGEGKEAIDDVPCDRVAKHKGRRGGRSQEIPHDEQAENAFDVRGRRRARERIAEGAGVEGLSDRARSLENKLFFDLKGVDASDDRPFEASRNGQLRGRLHERRLGCAVPARSRHNVRFEQRRDKLLAIQRIAACALVNETSQLVRNRRGFKPSSHELGDGVETELSNLDHSLSR